MEMLHVTSATESRTTALLGQPRARGAAERHRFFPKDYLLVADESSRSQIGGMYHDWRASRRSWTSAVRADNLAAQIAESGARRSATDGSPPGLHELTKTHDVVRPTRPRRSGKRIIRPEGQLLDDLLDRARKKERVLITTLTKRTAEDLTSYKDKGARAISTRHRQPAGAHVFDVLVGINLLRAYPSPQLSLVAIPPAPSRPRRLPAVGDDADPDLRPRRAKRRRPGHPLR